MDASAGRIRSRDPWNKGRLISQKLPLKLKEIWAIRIRLQLAERLRDLTLCNLAIHSKLRGCDLVSLRVKDVAQGQKIFHRAIVMQQKTRRPVQFEITKQTRRSALGLINQRELTSSQRLLHIRVIDAGHLSTR